MTYVGNLRLIEELISVEVHRRIFELATFFQGDHVIAPQTTWRRIGSHVGVSSYAEPVVEGLDDESVIVIVPEELSIGSDRLEAVTRPRFLVRAKHVRRRCKRSRLVVGGY